MIFKFCLGARYETIFIGYHIICWFHVLVKKVKENLIVVQNSVTDKISMLKLLSQK